MTKNMKYRNALRAYELGCEQVADAFIAQYFPGEDWHWVCGEVGGNVYIHPNNGLVIGKLYKMADMAACLKFLPHPEAIDRFNLVTHI